MKIEETIKILSDTEKVMIDIEQILPKLVISYKQISLPNPNFNIYDVVNEWREDGPNETDDIESPNLTFYNLDDFKKNVMYTEDDSVFEDQLKLLALPSLTIGNKGRLIKVKWSDTTFEAYVYIQKPEEDVK